ncbi:hypothetical protein C0J52_13118 [Blattella germanica]|nr:hypothetical protein C0J52_13118 [Blattella germanica]
MALAFTAERRGVLLYTCCLLPWSLMDRIFAPWSLMDRMFAPFSRRSLATLKELWKQAVSRGVYFSGAQLTFAPQLMRYVAQSTLSLKALR